MLDDYIVEFIDFDEIIVLEWIMDTMPKSQARAKARKYSRQYLTFWYVREVSPGQFAPWAHDSDDERTVATFYCGREWEWEPEA